MREEAQRTEAVAYAHHHNALLRELFTAIRRNRRSSNDEPAAIDPHQNRDFCRGGFCRTPDVQIEAVFVLDDSWDGLQALRCELIGGSNALPMRSWLRRSPSQVTDGRCG